MITYQVEKLSDVLHEIKPLLSKHWKEVAWYQDDIKLNPSYGKYLQMEELGMIHVVSVRDEEVLVGYNINFIHEHLHYSDHKYAVNDIIFLSPEYRSGWNAKGLVDFTEECLIEIGVSVVTMHMKTDHPFVSLMERVNFTRQEYIYSKYLGE